jgi:hypothetical protein
VLATQGLRPARRYRPQAYGDCSTTTPSLPPARPDPGNGMLTEPGTHLVFLPMYWQLLERGGCVAHEEDLDLLGHEPTRLEQGRKGVEAPRRR